jgi:hypothetical protein
VTVALLPFIVSAVALIVDVGSDYYPAGDVAGTELRTRDVGRHPVQLGLFSRDGWNHPGPLSFYLLAVPYRLAGSRSIGLNLGALLLNGAAIAGVVAIAKRRGGLPLMLLTLLGCGLVVHSLGPEFVREPWNVSMTVLPFGLLIFLAWEMTCGATWALPVAAFVASFCVQTHVGYALLAGPLCLVGTLCLFARRGDRSAVLRAALIAAGVLAVLWLPPVVQQLLSVDDGNLGKILSYFRNDSDKAVHTLTEGWRVMSNQFGLRPEWITGHRQLTPIGFEPTSLHSPAVPVLLVPFSAASLWLWRRREGDATRLAATVWLVLSLGVVWVARTLGRVYGYRLGWTWLVTMMASVVTLWAAWKFLEPHAKPMARRALGVVCALGVGVVTLVNCVDAARWGVPMPLQSPQVGALARQLGASLPAGDGDIVGRCSGDGCIYMSGLMLWLERHGYPARVDSATGLIGSDAPHRVHRRGRIRAVLDIEVSRPFGKFEAASDRPGRTMIAYVGTLPRNERARLIKRMSAIQAQQRAGALDDATFYAEAKELAKKLSTHAVGVFLAEPSPG